jgi:DNA-binding transcriptional LysR family regulator
MELRSVAYFRTVCEEGSLRAAAKKLGLTQPTLSKAIRRMEDEIGAVLFDRKARGVSLTVYGQSFLRHAKAVAASAADVRSEIDALRRGTTGTVSVGVGPSWISNGLAQAIRTLRAEKPGVHLKIVRGMDDGLKALLRSGEIDMALAVLPDAQAEPDLVGEPLLQDRYGVIACNSHPLHGRTVGLAELLDYPWMLSNSEATITKRLRNIFYLEGLTLPEPVIECDIHAIRFALMLDSPYLSVQALDHFHSMGVDGISPLDVGHKSWNRTAGLITRKDGEPNPSAIHLISLVRTCCVDGGWENMTERQARLVQSGHR